MLGKISIIEEVDLKVISSSNHLLGVHSICCPFIHALVDWY